MNEIILNKMESEIASLNEAKVAVEKAKEAVGKVGDVCGLLHLADEFDMSNLAQKYKAEIMQREKVSMAVAILTEKGIEIGSPFPFSKDAKAVFDLEGMHVVLRMLLSSSDNDDKDFDYIIRHVIKIITVGSAVDFAKTGCIENYTASELKALVAFLAGQKEYEELKSEAANRVDGVLSIV